MAIGANLTKRDQMLVAVSVLTFVAAAAYGYFLYLPKSDDLDAIQQHVDVLDKKNSQARADIANGSLQKLRLEAEQYAAELVLLRQIVPTTNEVPALLENVSTAARRVGLDLSSVEPMPVLIGEQFDTYRYKLSVTGGYHASRMHRPIRRKQRLRRKRSNDRQPKHCYRLLSGRRCVRRARFCRRRAGHIRTNSARSCRDNGIRAENSSCRNAGTYRRNRSRFR